MKIRKSAGMMIMAAVFGMGALAAGCGGAGGSDGDSGGTAAIPADLASVIGASLEDVTAGDVQDVFGGGADAFGAIAGIDGGEFLVEPSGAESALVPPPPPAPPWWLFLNPLRQRMRAEARKVIEAPAELAFYVLSHQAEMPACVTITESSCPLSPDVAGDTCGVRIDFAGPCEIGFTAGSTVLALQLSGAVSRDAEVMTASSGPPAMDGVIKAVFTAESFQVTDPATTRNMTYNGMLTRTTDGTAAAAPYAFRHVWVCDAGNDPMTLTDGMGGQLVANGTREAWVLPGNSAEHFINTLPTITPPGAPPMHVRRDVHRTFTRDGDTVTLSLDAVETQLDLGRTWLRTADHTLFRKNETKVVINGDGSVTDPRGRVCTTELVDVVHDLNHHAPISGETYVACDPGRSYIITFTGVCSFSWEDDLGNSGKVNYCQWDSFEG